MRGGWRILGVALLFALTLAVTSCTGTVSVGMSVPIGNPYGYGGPHGSVYIGSGPIYLR